VQQKISSCQKGLGGVKKTFVSSEAAEGSIIESIQGGVLRGGGSTCQARPGIGIHFSSRVHPKIKQKATMRFTAAKVGKSRTLKRGVWTSAGGMKRRRSWGPWSSADVEKGEGVQQGGEKGKDRTFSSHVGRWHLFAKDQRGKKLVSQVIVSARREGRGARERIKTT